MLVHAALLSSKEDNASVLYEGRAAPSDKADTRCMDEAQTWRDRLEAELGRSKRAARDVSVKAGAAPGDLIRSMPRRRVQFSVLYRG